MTTKPKAKKFRIRRSAPLGPAARDTAVQDQPDAPTTPTPQPAQGEVTSARQMSTETEIATIRKEGLTGRQLRMARRVAQKHALAPTSDFDAVRLLRQQGIDPFQRANTLELVVPKTTTTNPGQLPQTVPQAPPTPLSLDQRPPSNRDAEIGKIQRDIARRRRRKLLLLGARLAFFVALPTAIAGYYYTRIASPMYDTKSEFVIQQADAQVGGGLGGLFAGTQFATSQDSITVQSYLQSRDAMLRLDRDLGFKAHFSNPELDAIQRLPADASNEDAYKLYKKNVLIGYDQSEGIIKMQVIAADPDISAAYSRALLTYAEEQVDQLTQRLREDQMQGARNSYIQAEKSMREAQLRVIDLQEKFKVISGDIEVSLLTNLISTLELEVTRDRLALMELMGNARPNQAKVAPMERRIANLDAEIARLRGELTEGRGGGASVARISSELAVAQADLETRNLLLQQSLQQLETARIEANRQVRYLSLGVSPVPQDEASYPKAFENTLIAFFIFSGIYLMVSLTASILREQVSS